MKNKIVLLILVILCFIPSAVAYASYTNTQKAPVDDKTATSITIKDVDDRTFSYTREQDGDTADGLIKYFLAARKNATALSSLPDSLAGEKFFIVTISSRVRNESYEFYFSTDPTTNYFKAPDGTAYQMAEEDAKTFITTEYAESLYETSVMPSLVLSNEYTVVPDNAVWQYKNYTGSFVDSDVSSLVADTLERYEISGGLDLKFDQNPDYCSVRVTDKDGNLLYDDMYSNMSEFSFDKLGQVTVGVTARWYEDPSRSFCGELNYDFLTYVTEPAEFYLGADTVEAGRFIAVTAANVTKPENIIFTTTLANTPSPTFYLDGNYAVALIPIDRETETGLYSLTFTYGGTIRDFTLMVNNYGFGSSWYTIPDAVVTNCGNSSAIDAFNKVAEEIFANKSSTRYFSGYFENGISGTYSLMRGFGRYVFVNGAQEYTYRNDGVDFSASVGQDVIAANAGEVVYANYLDYTGNTIVIEHGYGLKTWYCNLDSISAKVGDKVERGDTIGKTGQTGYTGISGAQIRMSVGSTFVSPYDTWTKYDSSIQGDTAGKVVIPKIDE